MAFSVANRRGLRTTKSRNWGRWTAGAHIRAFLTIELVGARATQRMSEKDSGWCPPPDDAGMSELKFAIVKRVTGVPLELLEAGLQDQYEEAS